VIIFRSESRRGARISLSPHPSCDWPLLSDMRDVRPSLFWSIACATTVIDLTGDHFETALKSLNRQTFLT
jgi:hypothetical protein